MSVCRLQEAIILVSLFHMVYPHSESAQEVASQHATSTDVLKVRTTQPRWEQSANSYLYFKLELILWQPSCSASLLFYPKVTPCPLKQVLVLLVVWASPGEMLLTPSGSGVANQNEWSSCCPYPGHVCVMWVFEGYAKMLFPATLFSSTQPIKH